MRIFVANVGVNTSDAATRGMRSPLFEDGSFEMVPIKEGRRFANGPGPRRYCDLPSWTGRASSLAAFVPEKMREYAAHDDPDFSGMTYGDKLTGRAAALRVVRAGDLLLFLARLWGHDGRRFQGAGAFHFVGAMSVTHNLEFGPDRDTSVPEDVRRRVEKNAHAVRDHRRREAFRILVGDVRRSSRFRRAVPVTGEVAGILFGATYSAEQGTFHRCGKPVLNKNGSVRQLKRFGSITRTIQWFLDDERSDDRPSIVHLLEMIESAGRAPAPAAAASAPQQHLLRLRREP